MTGLLLSAAAVSSAQTEVTSAPGRPIPGTQEASPFASSVSANAVPGVIRSAETGPQQVLSTRGRARAAIADVAQKRAALEQAELNLKYTKIIAPVSGEVNKTVVVGMKVQPGQQLLNVVPLEQVWITANFKETQLRHMQAGQKAKIHADSSGLTFRGHVDSIAGATGPFFSLLPPENATGNYVKIVHRIPAKIVLEPGENRDHQLRPGVNVVPKVYLR